PPPPRPPGPHPPPPPPAGRGRRRPPRAPPPPPTLGITSLSVIAVFLDTTVLFVAFPAIGADFPTSDPAGLSWILNGYTIVFAALLVPAGKTADRFGHRTTFLIGSVVFTVSALACAVAPSPEVLIACRIPQAMGAAMLVPSSLALLLRATPRSLIPVALAMWGATGAVAGALGPTLGATIIEFVGWRGVFLIHLPVGAVTVWLGRRHLEGSGDPTTQLPAPLGVLLLVIGSSTVTLAIVRAGTWVPTRTLTTLATGLVVLGAFVVHQRRTPAPTMDPVLFASRNFRWANGASLVFGAAFSAMFLASILFLTQVWGWTILQAGLGSAPGPLLVAALAPFLGRLAARVGQRPLILLGGVLCASGGLWRVVFLTTEARYAADFLPSMVLGGVGVALCLPQLSSVIGQSLPADRLGVGGATNQAIRQFGGTLGVAMAIGLIAQPSSLADALLRFDRVWWMIAVGGLVTTLLCLPLRTRPPQRSR
ncbi:MAG: MFS transporter, partial [Nitriliruptoraceae bacterium]|nr:MFS transporter [Nitriliruptoraceae bacterium]